MTAQSGSAQTVAAEKSHDAFGQVVNSSGTWYGDFGYGGSFGYQSDTDYGLQLLGHRYYDASTGRFLTRDPIKDGRNWYGYCDGNPISRVDPNGHKWHDPVKVFVDQSFTGKVWVVGEPGKGIKQIFRRVLSGMSSPQGMDVDTVIIQDSLGRQKRYFLPGANSPVDPREFDSEYNIDKDGTVNEKAKKIVVSFMGLPPYVGPNPVDSPLPPIKFGKSKLPFPIGGMAPPGGGSESRDLNNDIEKAKGKPGSSW